jgi:hypothetical protein
MTQIRPEACTCRGKPVWCDACLTSGFARTAPWDVGAMPVPSRIAGLKAELIATGLENARLQREVVTLRAELAVALFGTPDDPDQQHANEPAPSPPGIPASALRRQHQAIGLLSTADAGRVRLGGYAPTLPR